MVVDVEHRLDDSKGPLKDEEEVHRHEDGSFLLFSLQRKTERGANPSSPSGNSSRSLRFSNRVVRDLIRRNQDVSSLYTNPINERATNALRCSCSAFCCPYLLEGIEVATVDDYLTTLMIWWT